MAGWNLTGNAVSAEFDGSDEQERKELSVSQAVEIAAGALDAIPQLSVLGEVTGFRGPNARSGHCYFQIICWRITYKHTIIYRPRIRLNCTCF